MYGSVYAHYKFYQALAFLSIFCSRVGRAWERGCKLRGWKTFSSQSSSSSNTRVRMYLSSDTVIYLQTSFYRKYPLLIHALVFSCNPCQLSNLPGITLQPLVPDPKCLHPCGITWAKCMRIDLRADLMLKVVFSYLCRLYHLELRPPFKVVHLFFADVAMTFGKASICIKPESDTAQLPSCHILPGAVSRPSWHLDVRKRKSLFSWLVTVLQ